MGAEDVYLGISGKTPASADCDTMIVRVKLPGCKLADIDLDVKSDRIRVETAGLCVSQSACLCDSSRSVGSLTAGVPRRKLATYLPERVRHKEGKATWDAVKCTLSVSLPLEKRDPFA